MGYDRYLSFQIFLPVEFLLVFNGDDEIWVCFSVYDFWLLKIFDGNSRCGPERQTKFQSEEAAKLAIQQLQTIQFDFSEHKATKDFDYFYPFYNYDKIGMKLFVE